MHQIHDLSLDSAPPPPPPPSQLSYPDNFYKVYNNNIKPKVLDRTTMLALHNSNYGINNLSPSTTTSSSTSPTISTSSPETTTNPLLAAAAAAAAAAVAPSGATTVRQNSIRFVADLPTLNSHHSNNVIT
jgi:hypothetical protein